jgi:hypothetical protein
MKIYLIKHKYCKILPYNITAYADMVESENGFYVKSVKAFLKLKEAKEYIKTHWESDMSNDYEIITFEPSKGVEDED